MDLMSDSYETAVSPQIFFGFGFNEIHNALLECLSIKLFLKEDIKFCANFYNKTFSSAMTEEFKNADFKTCAVNSIDDMDNSSVSHSDKTFEDHQTKINEVVSTPTKFDCCPAEQYFYTGSSIKSEIPSSSEFNIPSDFFSESQAKTNYLERSNETRSLQQNRAYSPLLFTPVKGENNYSDGFRTPNNQFTPTDHNSKTLDSSKKCISMVSSTPSPKSANRRTLFPALILSMSSQKDEIPLKNEESNLSPKSRSPPHEMRALPANRHSEIKSLVVEREHSLQISENNTGLVITSPANTISTQKLCRSTSLSPAPLHIKKCILENQVKDSIICDKATLENSHSSELEIQKTGKEGESNGFPHVDPPKYVSTRPYHRTKRRHRLRTLLSRVRRSLNGLPPPPSVTIPQLTVDDMLEKLKGSGQDVFSLSASEKISSASSSKNVVSLFHPSATENEIMHMAWPSVLDSVHPGVCYNLGYSSEALEELCQQVREKFVGSETASSCSIWSVPGSGNETKSNRRRDGNFQGSSLAREGYITRRRRAFSLASLSTSVPSVASKSRKILVTGVQKKPKENKPEKIKQRRESGGNKVTKKEDSKHVLSKKCFGDKGKNMSKLNSIRKTLTFDACSSSLMHSTTNASNSSSSLNLGVPSLIGSTKRTLNFDIVANLTIDKSSELKNTLEAKVLPSVSRDGNNAFSSITEDGRKSLVDSGIKLTKELSEVHKKKLLWAVAEALRSRGLSTGHDKFKMCAIPLFRYCRDEFLNIPTDGKEIKRNNTGDNSFSSPSIGQTDQHKESTSDKMLKIALGFVDKIMNEMGVTPVIKQKITLI